MQYHYVVFYDSVLKRWAVEFDADAYFPDGNVWDDARADEYGYGWFFPEEDADEALTEQTLCNILYDTIGAIPIPREHESDRKRSPIGSLHADLVKEHEDAL